MLASGSIERVRKIARVCVRQRLLRVKVIIDFDSRLVALIDRSALGFVVVKNLTDIEAKVLKAASTCQHP